MKVVEYDASRRTDLADLMGRVWGERPAEDALAWFYERNPVRPASVLLAEADGKTVGTAAISFVRMTIGGAELEVGMPLRVATDSDYRGRGIFGKLEAENEERVGALGVSLLLTVPNAASAPVFLNRLGWTALPPLRVWAAARIGLGRARAAAVSHFGPGRTDRPGGPDRVLRDAAWLDWRFADSPTPYTLLEHEGYAVAGRRGRLGVVAAVSGDLLGDAVAASGGGAVIAAPPSWEHAAYARRGFVPTHRTLAVLGKSLDPGQRIPERPHYELGDLDFI